MITILEYFLCYHIRQNRRSFSLNIHGHWQLYCSLLMLILLSTYKKLHSIMLKVTGMKQYIMKQYSFTSQYQHDEHFSTNAFKIKFK